MTLNRTAVNLLTIWAGQAAFLIASTTFHIIGARLLGAVGYGQLGFAISFGIIVCTISEFGLTQLVIRELATAAPHPHTFGTALLVRSLLMLVIFPLGLVSLLLLHVEPTKWLLAALILIGYIFFSWGHSFRWFFYARQTFQYEVSVTLTISALLFFFSLGLLYLNPFTSPYWFGLAFTVTHVIGFLVALFWVLRAFPKLNFETNFKKNVRAIRKLFGQIAPFTLMAVCSAIYLNSDVVLLSLLKGDIETGLYGPAAKLASGLRLISFSFQQVLLPQFANLTTKPSMFKTKLTQFLLWVCGLAVAISYTILFLGRPLILTLFGTTYHPSILFFKILGVALCITLLNTVVSTALIAKRQEKKAAQATLFGLAVNLTANFLLIPKWGGLGASLAMLSSELGMCLCLFYQGRRLFTDVQPEEHPHPIPLPPPEPI